MIHTYLAERCLDQNQSPREWEIIYDGLTNEQLLERLRARKNDPVIHAGVRITRSDGALCNISPYGEIIPID